MYIYGKKNYLKNSSVYIVRYRYYGNLNPDPSVQTNSGKPFPIPNLKKINRIRTRIGRKYPEPPVCELAKLLRHESHLLRKYCVDSTVNAIRTQENKVRLPRLVGLLHEQTAHKFVNKSCPFIFNKLLYKMDKKWSYQNFFCLIIAETGF